MNGKLLVIDNYDSFTYNLVHMIEQLGDVELTVRRNDKIELSEVDSFDQIILSPGPGLPSEAGRMPEIVKTYAPTKKILGVCLGHQCIGEVFGGTLHNLSLPVHGKATPMTVTDPADPVFHGLPESVLIGRYHSWVVNQKDLPEVLKVTAVDESGNIMAFRHLHYRVCGVQFHPESVLTPDGRQMLQNWLERA